MVQEMEAELGIPQRLGEVAQRDSPLAGVVRLAVILAECVQKPGVRPDAERCEGVGLWRQAQARIAEELCAGDGNHRPLCPRPHVVGDREVAAHRVDPGLLPLDLVEALDGEHVGRRHRGRGHPHRHQRLAQLRARQPELAHVEGVDGVDPVLDEGALAPVEHVLAEPEVDGRVAGIERSGHVEIEHLEVLRHPILRVGVQVGALPRPVLVLEVDEPGHAGEGPEAAGADVEVAGELGGVADQAAVVVEVAVVVVGLGRQLGIALGDAVGQAVGDRRIQAPLDLPVAELDGLNGQPVQEAPEGNGARRQAAGASDGWRKKFRTSRRIGRPPRSVQPGPRGCTGLKYVPHGVSLSRWVRRRRVRHPVGTGAPTSRQSDSEPGMHSSRRALRRCPAHPYYHVFPVVSIWLFSGSHNLS